MLGRGDHGGDQYEVRVWGALSEDANYEIFDALPMFHCTRHKDLNLSLFRSRHSLPETRSMLRRCKIIPTHVRDARSTSAVYNFVPRLMLCRDWGEEWGVCVGCLP